MEFLNEIKVKNIEDIGLMENRMEKENFIIMQLNNGKSVWFKMVKKLNGLIKK